MAGKRGQERAELKILLDLSSAATGFVDLAQCMSVLNRRNYDQSRCYHVSKITVTANANLATVGAAQAVFMGAPNTWVTANAWVKAEAAWKRSRAEVLKNNPSIEGKWDTFKVFLDATHAAAGAAANMVPAGAKLGEWNMSSLVLPDVTPATPIVLDTFNMHLLGDNAGDPTDGSLTSAGLIQGYSETRALVTEKDVPADAGDSWLVRLFDMGEQESALSDIIVDEGELPPYDRDDLPGTGSNNEQQILGVASVSNYELTKEIPGFYVPGGLMMVSSVYDYSPAKLRLGAVIHLTPGDYKGVHAPHIRQ